MLFLRLNLSNIKYGESVRFTYTHKIIKNKGTINDLITRM